ncbi:MAG TPA: IS21 family transposase [Acidimicrobiales bacterium]|nr:IS21 family transposase [Acidimicrobiales bacterium]
MELFEQIRKAHEKEGLSVRELATRFRTHRRTVRQALKSAVPPARKPPPPRVSPVLEAWKPIIDGWLEADKEAPKKQRHTARRIYQRLQEECQADVGESTVRRYVAQKKESGGVPLPEVTVPQHHPLGEEAEVDFGDVGIYLCGLLLVAKMFVMRLSASGKGFHHIYLHECQEAFFDGHVRAFESFGGVPSRIRYDNLKPAVVKVMKGRNRTESDRFVALRSHYGFDSFFCIPGSRAPTRRAASKERSGASAAAVSCRCRRSSAWRRRTCCARRAISPTTPATSSVEG